MVRDFLEHTAADKIEAPARQLAAEDATSFSLNFDNPDAVHRQVYPHGRRLDNRDFEIADSSVHDAFFVAHELTQGGAGGQEFVDARNVITRNRVLHATEHEASIVSPRHSHPGGVHNGH